MYSLGNQEFSIDLSCCHRCGGLRTLQGSSREADVDERVTNKCFVVQCSRVSIVAVWEWGRSWQGHGLSHGRLRWQKLTRVWGGRREALDMWHWPDRTDDVTTEMCHPDELIRRDTFDKNNVRYVSEEHQPPGGGVLGQVLRVSRSNRSIVF